MKKKIISIFIAFVFSFSFVFCYPLNPVSASEVSFDFPETWYSSSSSESTYSILFDYLKNNPNYNNIIGSKGLTGIAVNGNNVYIQLIPDPIIQLSTSSYFYFYNSTAFYSTILSSSSLSSASFCSFTSYSQSGSSVQGLSVSVSGSSFNWCQIRPSSVGSSTNLMPYVAFSSKGFGFVPSPSVLYGLDLDINETDFYDWIIDNNKLVELPNYITTNKLMSFIQFYKNFGGSFSNFLKNIPDWFSYMNIVNQSSDNVNVLKSSMDKLYQEYINSYWHVIYPDFSNIPTHRRNISTNTTDTNTTLITDDSNDTVDISILRDVLRGIISINNSISDGVISIINKLDQLDFTVNVANGGGSFSSAEIWGSGDITQSSNYQTLSDVFVEHGVIISDVESLQYNYLAGQTQKDSFTVSVDMPDEYINGEFTKKTITHTVDSTSKMYDTLVLFRKIIALAVILFYVVRLKLALPSLIKGE